MKLTARFAIGSFVLCLLAVAMPAAGAPVPEQPTFSKDVLPILQRNCQDCHRPKPMNMSGMVAPFSLATHQDARPWAKSIARAVQAKVMPPWFATEHTKGQFYNERGLTADEIAVVARWEEAGAPAGNRLADPGRYLRGRPRLPPPGGRRASR